MPVAAVSHAGLAGDTARLGRLGIAGAPATVTAAASSIKPQRIGPPGAVCEGLSRTLARQRAAGAAAAPGRTPGWPAGHLLTELAESTPFRR